LFIVLAAAYGQYFSINFKNKVKMRREEDWNEQVNE